MFYPRPIKLDKVLLLELPIDEIQILDKNPRTIDADEFDKLRADINNDPNFLLQRPPLVNQVNDVYYCYAGTQRLKAAKANGSQSIYCFIENDVPGHVQDERMLKDNLHRGQWDEEKLLSLNIDIEVMNDFGFKDFEVSIFDSLNAQEPKDLTAPLKDAPPTMKITFESTKQMEFFECKLKDMIEDFERLHTISYSVSQGEI